MGEAPLAKPYDPDRWSRRWAAAAAVALVAAPFFPRYVPYDDIWRWPWQETAGVRPSLSMGLGITAGLVAGLATLTPSSRVRRWLLACAAILAVTVHAMTWMLAWPEDLPWLTVTRIPAICAAAMAAANHFLRRGLAPRPARQWAAINAVILGVAVLTPIVLEPRGLGVFRFNSGTGVLGTLYVAYILAYAAMSFWAARPARMAHIHLVLAVMGRAFLLLWPIYEIVWRQMSLERALGLQYWPAPIEAYVVTATRWMCSDSSVLALCALTIAVWMEPRLLRSELNQRG